MGRQPVFGPLQAAQSLTQPRSPALPTNLTKRELAVLRHAARGLSASETGKRLKISNRTVEVHVSHARLKLKAKSLTHAVVLAIKKKLIKV